MIKALDTGQSGQKDGQIGPKKGGQKARKRWTHDNGQDGGHIGGQTSKRWTN